MTPCLKNFTVIRPKYEAKQEALLDWIAGAHIHVQGKAPSAEEGFAEELRETLFKIGLGSNKIQKRGFVLDDCNHRNWEEMQIYNIEYAPEGYHLDKRMDLYNQTTSQIFEEFYPDNAPLPSHLIHVTCTGYVAPSPAQKLVSLRGMGKETMVTHAYHMGCYAAIPSIRMALGHFYANEEASDIVHTELSSIHMNPSFHSKEQLVVQSLFADGFIKYSLDHSGEPGSLTILGVLEEIIEGSIDNMTWHCQNWGFQMSISREVPVRIRKELEGYLQRLAKKSGRDILELKSAVYAIHPGGPKIIEQIAQKLELKDEQFAHSQEILYNCGNMSSGTLPHVWEKIINDENIVPGQLIVSLAFGPGLSISGALFEKR
ncbi:MAG: Alpha-pyrone synthesis polyketide synthase-like Pks18 [Chlamydiae bacterium]|nr:Alpha-pyrone synthesis polyketide synthase-like Pks18 [Chlamydiota bacterium]